MGMRHFDVQLIGGMVLNDGCIAEMKTGEGKTLTATLAVVLNSLAVTDHAVHRQDHPDPDFAEYPDLVDPDAAIDPEAVEDELSDEAVPAEADGALTRRGVHVVTVNDYLAKRDAEWMKPIYDALGVSVGVLQNMQPYDEKQRAYACDVIYGTNSELGFDYLRDNMAKDLSEKVQRGHYFAVVDEVDNILIDEARTPLIISGCARTGGGPVHEVRALGAADDRGEDARRHGSAYEEGLSRGLRLRDRREAQERLDHRAGRGEGREIPRHRPSLSRRERAPGQPPDPVAARRVAVQARRRLRGGRRRGEDHRRVHRPDPRRPALVGGAAPGNRGEGGRERPGGEPDACDDHLPELLPAVRQARGHDRHGADRGDGVHEDLRAAGRAGPDEHADGPRRPQRSGLQDQRGQVERGRERDRGAA